MGSSGSVRLKLTEEGGLPFGRRHGRPVAYRKLEVGERWPSWETYDRIAAAFGWPMSFR